MRDNFRRILSVILTVLMIISVFSVLGVSAETSKNNNGADSYNVSVQNSQGLFDSGASKKYKTGDEFELSILFKAGTPLLSGQFEFLFDADALVMTDLTYNPKIVGSINKGSVGIKNKANQKENGGTSTNFQLGNSASPADFTSEDILMTACFKVQNEINKDEVVKFEITELWANTSMDDWDNDIAYVESGIVDSGYINDIYAYAELSDAKEQPTQPPTTETPTTEKLEPTTTASEPTTEMPETTTKAPEPTTEKPEPTTTAPEPTTQKSEPTTTKKVEPTTEKPEPPATTAQEESLPEGSYKITVQSSQGLLVSDTSKIYKPGDEFELNILFKAKVPLLMGEFNILFDADALVATDVSFGKKINGSTYSGAVNDAASQKKSGGLFPNFDANEPADYSEESVLMTVCFKVQNDINKNETIKFEIKNLWANSSVDDWDNDITYVSEGVVDSDYKADLSARAELSDAIEPTTVLKTEAPTTAKPTTQTPTTAKPATQAPTTTVPLGFYKFYYLPSSEQENSGNTYKLNYKDNNGGWHIYTMEKTSLIINGISVYSVSVLKNDTNVSELQYQVYNGDEWLSQIDFENADLTDYNEKMVRSDGTVELPTEPVTTTNFSEPVTEKTEPATTNAPEPTTEKPEPTTEKPEPTATTAQEEILPEGSYKITVQSSQGLLVSDTSKIYKPGDEFELNILFKAKVPLLMGEFNILFDADALLATKVTFGKKINGLTHSGAVNDSALQKKNGGLFPNFNVNSPADYTEESVLMTVYFNVKDTINKNQTVNFELNNLWANTTLDDFEGDIEYALNGVVNSDYKADLSTRAELSDAKEKPTTSPATQAPTTEPPVTTESVKPTTEPAATTLPETTQATTAEEGYRIAVQSVQDLFVSDTSKVYKPGDEFELNILFRAKVPLLMGEFDVLFDSDALLATKVSFGSNVDGSKNFGAVNDIDSQKKNGGIFPNFSVNTPADYTEEKILMTVVFKVRDSISDDQIVKFGITELWANTTLEDWDGDVPYVTNGLIEDKYKSEVNGAAELSDAKGQATQAPTTTAPEPTTTQAPTTTAPEPTTTQAPTTTAPKPTTTAAVDNYTFYYLPSASDESSGYTYKLNYNDPNGTDPNHWHIYDLTRTSIIVNGVYIYSVSVPKYFDRAAQLQYQVYNSGNWVSQNKFENVKLSDFDNMVVKSDGALVTLEEASAPEKGYYYLAGTMNNWSVNEAYKLVENPNNPGEYMLLGFTANAKNGMKIAYSNNGISFKDTDWYPTGYGNDYIFEKSGVYNVYFRPDGNAEWSNGYFYVETVETVEPTTEQATTAPEKGDYYVAGSMNNWAPDEDYKLVDNPNNPGEYMLLGFTAKAKSGMKIAYSSDGVSFKDTDWYPSGYGNDYLFIKDGKYNVYFRPDGNAEWTNGYFYVETVETVEPTTEQATTAPEKGDYYAAGTMNDWLPDNEFKLVENPNNPGEYMLLGFTAKEEYRMKIAYSTDGVSFSDWYPAGVNNDYLFDEGGIYNVYFRPDGNADWENGFFYVEKIGNIEPTTEQATTAPEKGDYYAAGTMNNWLPDEEYKLSENPIYPGEYMLMGFSAKKGFGMKIAYSTDGVSIKDDDWYPTGMGNDYMFDEDGIYNVYFRPDGNADWENIYFYVEKVYVPEPTTEEPTTEEPTTKQPATEEPTTEQPTSEAPTTEQVTTTACETTEEPAVSTPAVEPATEPYTTEPVTSAETVEATTAGPVEPTTFVPVTEPVSSSVVTNPVTEPPVTEPLTEAPTTIEPSTDATVTEPDKSIPIIEPTTDPLVTEPEFIPVYINPDKSSKTDISKWKVSGIKNKTYTGKKITQSIKVTNGDKKASFKVEYKNNTNAGKAQIKIIGTGKYKGVIKKTFIINKKNQPAVITVSKKAVKISKIKNKAVIIKPLKIKNAKGKVTFTKVKSKLKKTIYKKITVDKKNGKIKLGKGNYPKGTLKISVKIKIAGNKNYKGKTLKKTVKVKIV